jgi:hypothetical protein
MNTTPDDYGTVSPKTIAYAHQKRLAVILDKRALNFLDEAYGGDLDAVAEHVKMKVICPCDPIVGGTYTLTGLRWAVQFGRRLISCDDREDWHRHSGTGDKTALRVGAALIVTGRATLADCFPKDRGGYELKDREFFNELLRKVAYHGELLPGRKNMKADPQARRRRVLEERKAKIETQLAELRRQIAEIDEELYP